MISILREYKFVSTADTDSPPEVDNFFQITPVKHLRVKIVSV